MSILERICDPAEWEDYFAHKVAQGNLHRTEEADLRAFIDGGEYLPAARNILEGGTFEPPVKTLVNKSKVGRKRVVYTFCREENYILKLITYMLREYDDIFAPNLYSFRRSRGVKLATDRILGLRDLDSRFVYKLDISNYFNSVDVELLLPELEAVLAEDPKLYRFIEGLLRCPYVRYNGEIIEEQKGIMAGVPISTFLANLYLRELDFYFYRRRIPYMRYSDDIIVFAKSEVQMQESAEYIKSVLAERHLRVNPEKEVATPPGEMWTFLGFSYYRGEVDISPVSCEKLKGKIRRKTRALSRWADRKEVPGDRAAKALVRRFNAKLYDNPVNGELTWARWFFPVINTDKTLRRMDAYLQDSVRYLATGKRNKGRFAFTYEDIKALGYRSLVHEYYKGKSESR